MARDMLARSGGEETGRGCSSCCPTATGGGRSDDGEEVKANGKRQAAEGAALDRKCTMAQAQEAIEAAIKSVAASDQTLNQPQDKPT